jgi:hypothetical protein
VATYRGRREEIAWPDWRNVGVSHAPDFAHQCYVGAVIVTIEDYGWLNPAGAGHNARDGSVVVPIARMNLTICPERNDKASFHGGICGTERFGVVGAVEVEIKFLLNVDISGHVKISGHIDLADELCGESPAASQYARSKFARSYDSC